MSSTSFFRWRWAKEYSWLVFGFLGKRDKKKLEQQREQLIPLLIQLKAERDLKKIREEGAGDMEKMYALIRGNADDFVEFLFENVSLVMKTEFVNRYQDKQDIANIMDRSLEAQGVFTIITNAKKDELWNALWREVDEPLMRKYLEKQNSEVKLAVETVNEALKNIILIPSKEPPGPT